MQIRDKKEVKDDGNIDAYVSFLCGAPDKRQNNQTFVSSLVPVHSVHLHTGERRRLQQSGDALQLLPVGRDDANITGLTPSLKRGKKGHEAEITHDIVEY